MVMETNHNRKETNSMTSTKQRIYTNDVAIERAKQDQAAQSARRLAVLRNRMARAEARKLTVIAMVAHERGDRTIEREARERLGLEPGTKLADTVELVQSRRPSVSRTAQALQIAPMSVEQVEGSDGHPEFVEVPAA